MKKWILLGVIVAVLLLVNYFFSDALALHATYHFMVGFFAIQTIVLFRIDSWAPKEWTVQASLAKIVIRLLASMVFALVLIMNNGDRFNLVIQFFSIYLIFMVFEIGMALTNLRRN